MNTGKENNLWAVITGATSGIGLATAMGLARKGWNIIGCGRSEQRCIEAREKILQAQPGTQVHYLIADLSCQRSVFGLSKAIKETVSQDGKIDTLIHTAGTFTNWFKVTEDGLELQLAVNYLAPFILSHELLPHLSRAGNSRIITVSSGSHYYGKMHWDDINLHKHYGGLKAYSQSKLATVLFTAEFNRKYFWSLGVRAFASDPGLVNTEIGMKATTGIARLVWNYRKRFGKSPEEGAATSLFLATSREPMKTAADNLYWKNLQPIKPSKIAMSRDSAERLWNMTTQITGIDESAVIAGCSTT